jgi:hypothetical protein
MGEWLVSTFPQRPGQIIGVATPSASVKEKTKVLKWNDKDRKWEPREQKLESEFDTGTLLLSVNEPRFKEEIQGRQRTFNVPRESIGLNQFGDLVRHEETADVDDASRKSVVEHYNDLMSRINSQTEGSSAGGDRLTPGGAGGDPTNPGKKKGRGGKGNDDG